MTTSNGLGPREWGLLQELLERRRPHLVAPAKMLSSGNYIDFSRVDDIRDAIGDEFVAAGLDADGSVPNSYGIELEDLIDRVGRISGLFG